MTQPLPARVICRLSRGAFSSERVFRVHLASGGEYAGVAPAHYCYQVNGEGLTWDMPAEGERIDGLVDGIVLSGLDQPAIRVEVPSGEIITVPKSELRLRKVETQYVPVGS